MKNCHEACTFSVFGEKDPKLGFEGVEIEQWQETCSQHGQNRGTIVLSRDQTSTCLNEAVHRELNLVGNDFIFRIVS